MPWMCNLLSGKDLSLWMNLWFRGVQRLCYDTVVTFI